MKENLERSLALTFHHEGGYVNNPNDPGGPTNWGITQATLSAYRKRKVSASEVRTLGKAEATQILKEMYWDPIRGDDLPNGLDYAVFDFCVNSGPARAAKELQEILEVAPDGIIGLKTLAAIKGFRVETLIRNYVDARMEYLQSLRTWKTFGRGWTRRVTGKDPQGVYKDQLGVLGEALAMAQGRKPLGIDHAPVAMGKARDSDRKATATVRSKASLATVAGIVGTSATDVAQQLAPAQDYLEWVKWGIMGLTVVAAVSGAVAVVVNMREEGVRA